MLIVTQCTTTHAEILNTHYWDINDGVVKVAMIVKAAKVFVIAS